MALLFKVEGKEDFAKIFAAYDLYSSIVNDLFGRILTPDDDFFTAPWCFMPESECGGFIVMTCQVPYLPGAVASGHGHVPGTDEKKDDWREQHFQRAREMMSEYSPYIVSPHVETGPEGMQSLLTLDEDDIFTFTRDGCYPGKDDISQALEDQAVKVTCEAMGWEIPTNWRQERERDRALWYIEGVFDLAEHDTNKMDEKGVNKRMKYSIDPCATLISREGGEHEEKRDSLHDRHDVEHETVEQQVNHSIDSRSTLIPREGGQHGEKKDSIHEHCHGGCESIEQHYFDTLYNDTNVVDENEEHCHPYLGHEHVEPQQIDMFYDQMDGNEEGHVEV